MFGLRKSDEVWTEDGQKLGHPHRLYHRISSIDPALGYYASYLRVMSYDMGDDFYVPTDFIAGRADGQVRLSVSMKRVLQETWDRLPDFIPQGQASTEEIPGTLFDS